jgi:protein involved in polysaccharide export with SLBB domain
LVAGADTQTADLTQHDVAGRGELKATNAAVALASLLSGDAGSDAMLHNGDVLTIRQVPGWNDLGATINVTGEVKNPGIYGIRPGEHLSSVLQRAGGFQADAYPYGAVLQRKQVRELELQAQLAMVLRVKESQSTLDLLPDKDAAQKQAKDATLQQWQATLDVLAANPPIGRVAVRIGPDLTAWQSTPADIEVRAGDTITIPKTPSYVMVTGQVFNATAIAIRPGKSANWYLSQAGGPTPLANRKAIFVIRADGSVIGSKKTLWVGDSLNAPLRPGDTIVVPEKPFGGPVEWQTVFAAAQVASAVASTVFIALRY